MGTPREREGGMVKFGKSGDVDEADERMETGDGGREWRPYVRRMSEEIVNETIHGVSAGNGPSDLGT